MPCWNCRYDFAEVRSCSQHTPICCARQGPIEHPFVSRYRKQPIAHRLSDSASHLHGALLVEVSGEHRAVLTSICRCHCWKQQGHAPAPGGKNHRGWPSVAAGRLDRLTQMRHQAVVPREHWQYWYRFANHKCRAPVAAGRLLACNNTRMTAQLHQLSGRVLGTC